VSGARLSFAFYLRYPSIKVAMISVGALLVVAAVFAALWWPVEQRRQELSASVDRERNTILASRRQEELASAYSRAKAGVDVLQKKLTYAATQAQQVADIAQLARRHDVMMLSQDYEESTRANEPSMLYTDLTMQSKYPALRSFVEDLAGLPSWTEVQEVSVERARESGMVKSRIRLVTYRRALAVLEAGR
jgi:type II secretory pathway component PulM